MDSTLVSNNQAFSVTGLGGGIGNDGNGLVTITNSTLQNNSAGTTGGGYGDRNARGSLTVLNSLFLNNTAAGNGGGIAVGGPATSLTNSEIDGNTSGGSGGGIYANGTTLTIQSSTIANNTANGNGAGVELDTTGTGAITGSTITDSTFTGNMAKNSAGANGGGIEAGAAFTGGLKLLNDTINANSGTTGGGIFWTAITGSSLSLENTIVAKNSAGTGPDASSSSAFTDVGGNLLGVSGSGSGNTGFTSSSTQTGTAATPLDPLLGALANNGGPTIGVPGSTRILQTEAPLTGSPALGKGILTGAPANDERGSPSVTNGKINVGAVSLVPQPPAPPPTSPRTLEKNVLTDLMNFQKNTLNQDDVTELGEAITDLNAALTSSFYVDDSHLNHSTGDQVFINDNAAVTEMMELYNDALSKVPKAALLADVNTLAQADQQFAAIAIMDATNAKGNANELSVANGQLQTGISDVNAGKFTDAINAFWSAWLDAGRSL
jgi:predicted outer membrane repeat protein